MTRYIDEEDYQIARRRCRKEDAIIQRIILRQASKGCLDFSTVCEEARQELDWPRNRKT